MKNLTWSVGLIVAGLILLFGGCNTYNSLVNLDEDVENEWGKVQSAYQRRADLIPNLVNTVKGVANFEQTTLENVVKARASATQMKVDAKDLTPEKLQEFQASQGQLSQALGRLFGGGGSVVFQEFFKSDIRQRMIQQRQNSAQRASNHIGSGFG